MNLKLGLASVTLAIASLSAAAPALADGVSTKPIAAVSARFVARAPGYGQQRNDAGFAARARARMVQIEQQVRAGVASGTVRPAALGAVSQQRARVDAEIARAERDGVIAQREERRVDQLVDQMAHVVDGYRVRGYVIRTARGF